MRITQVVAVAVAALTLALGSVVAKADVPQTMNYQGVLKNTAGVPMPGSHSMTFRLYRDSTGGLPLWEEPRSVTVDSAGLFNVLLGTITPIPDSVFATGAYMGITIAPDAEMAHRVALASVGYAYRVNSVDGAAGGNIIRGLSFGQYPFPNLRFQTSSGLGDYRWEASPDGHFYLYDQLALDYRVFVGSDGDVGIGTVNPIGRLHVSGGPLVADYPGGQIRIAGGTVHGGLWTGNSDVLRVADWETGTKGLAINLTSGNVGIGTTSPRDALEVYGTISSRDLRVYGDLVNYHELRHNGTTGALEIAPIGGTNLVVPNGNVGIGTPTPAAKLHVAGSEQVDGSVSASTYYGDGSHLTGIAGTTDNDWTINGNDIYHLIGNVGIGTSTPSRNLMVAGDADFNGSDAAELVRVENHDAATNADGIFARTHSLDGGAGLSGDAIEITDGNTYGVLGVTKARSTTSGSGAGVYGWAAYTGNCGDVFGVLGVTEGIGGTGVGSNTTAGVYGLATATTGTNFGVFGEVKSSNPDMAGVYGIADTLGSLGTYGRVHGVLGLTHSPISGSAGVFGASARSGVTYGVFGRQDSPSGYAGKFQGNVDIMGTLTKGGGAFRIDHPLDPGNKYLSHSFVESPDMMNVYNGNVTTDANGDASVVLPGYFEALNRDFRYQLTVVGKQFAQARVEEEITNNQFKIKTDKPNIRVSWQVTGVRQDAFANMHRIIPEQEKPVGERGTYLYPKEQGLPEPQVESVDYSTTRR